MTNLSNPPTKPKPTIRALIVCDLRGEPVIIATDDAGLLLDVSDIGSSARDLGLVSRKEAADMESAGFYLWQGTAEPHYDFESGMQDDISYETSKITKIEPADFALFSIYLAMTPPMTETPPDALPG